MGQGEWSPIMEQMNCLICGGRASKVKERKIAKYRDETVEVESEFFQCEPCQEEFVTPEQMKQHVRTVKNEVRRKHGLLAPEKISQIRRKLKLTQEELEELLGTGPKVVVRWESGKVIQSNGHDNMLRLLECHPGMVDKLRQVQALKVKQQKEYARSHQGDAVAAAEV